MAKQQQQHGYNTYTITASDNITSITVLPERGAFGSSIIMPTKDGPREMLFQHDFFWEKEWPGLPGGLPFLFPVCARISRDGKKGIYLYDGKQYELGIHGFGWTSAWEVDSDTDNTITMRLLANEHTLAVYPFKFEVILQYTVEPGKLICHTTFTNHGKHDMPYYAGFHPYLRMPEPGSGKDGVMLDYKPIRRLKYNEAMTDIIGEQPLFELPTAITNPEILEQLTILGEDKEVRLHIPNGPTIHLESSGIENHDLFSYVQLYTMADKPFFCAEHWMAFPNAINTVKGAQWLRPGQSENGFLKMWIN